MVRQDDATLLYILAWFVPPVAVALSGAGFGQVCLNITLGILTLHIGAIVHAFCIVHGRLKYHDPENPNCYPNGVPPQDVAEDPTPAYVPTEIHPVAQRIASGPMDPIPDHIARIGQVRSNSTEPLLVPEVTSVQETSLERKTIALATTVRQPSSLPMTPVLESDDVMWRRLPLHHRKETTIGRPILIETTYDEGALERIPKVSDLSVKLPPLDFGSSAPSNDSPDPRVVSSACSRPSTDFTPSSPSPNCHHDVSRPISPVQTEPVLTEGYRRASTSSPVSPVDVTVLPSPAVAQAQRTFASNIPALHKAKLSVTAFTPDAASRIMRWDDFSKGPSASPSSKPSHSKPSTYTPPIISRYDEAPSGVQAFKSGVPRSKRSSFAERAAKLGNGGLYLDTGPREEWKGASGRSALVDPLADNPLPVIRPLAITRQSQKKPVPPLSGDSNNNIPVSAKRRTYSETHAASHGHVHEGEWIKPIVPLKAGRNSPLRAVTSPISLKRNANAHPNPRSPNIMSQPPMSSWVKDHVLPAPTEDFENMPPTVEPQEPTDDMGDSCTALHHESASRFSWTTYATTAYQESTPPSSPPPPMPSFTRSPNPAASVVSRRRPVATNETTSPYAPYRPAHSASATATSHRSHRLPASSPPTSTATPTPTSATKALPPAPPQLHSTDPISALEAHLADLAHRRTNLHRIIANLQALQPRNPIVQDIAAHRATERQIEAHRAELADLEREVHEVGLRLVRARGREGEGEASLWVRRVTK
ncbi:hypothetical protein B0A49_03992 [Cryomyces minteri]|uniref:Uncharacterized protein n=1 Tax=Cryomyces minteri TaxID=331657 RepID=A0A4V5NGU7_9PEZI|nr:hypothetical protein B0A49_03992 [Cryomyces minteri]